MEWQRRIHQAADLLLIAPLHIRLQTFGMALAESLGGFSPGHFVRRGAIEAISVLEVSATHPPPCVAPASSPHHPRITPKARFLEAGFFAGPRAMWILFSRAGNSFQKTTLFPARAAP